MMLRHSFRLMWNRKRAGALLILEIFISYLVVFGVVLGGLYFYLNYQAPLGFVYENVFVVAADMQTSDEAVDPAQTATVERMLQEIRALPEVVAAAGARTTPYGFGSWISRLRAGGQEVEVEQGSVTLGYLEAMQLQLEEGRFFEKSDEALTWTPVLINRALARQAFGGENPLGRRLVDPEPDGSGADLRVIGVLNDFRHEGELAAPGYFLFTRHQGETDRAPSRLMVRVQPGTPAAFEEKLAQLLQAMAPTWSFEVKPLAQLRAASFDRKLRPLLMGAVVAAFLMVMVGLGLTGVLWQNLLRRTREMGLRRAVGATAGKIRVQVLFEQLILTSFGVGAGALLVAQIPLLELKFSPSGQVLAGSILLAMLAIYLLTILCALYPSSVVSRVRPAEALRYE